MGKIKSWKKTTNTKNKVEWHGNDGDAIEVSYYPNYQSSNYHWLVGANGLLHIKKFKTKKEALESAYRYMRCHPNG